MVPELGGGVQDISMGHWLPLPLLEHFGMSMVASEILIAGFLWQENNVAANTQPAALSFMVTTPYKQGMLNFRKMLMATNFIAFRF